MNAGSSHKVWAGVPGFRACPFGHPGMTTQKQIGEPILTADRITLAFGGVKALDGDQLRDRRHEILAIIGPNGAGKTSMLNFINGFYHPQAGTITWKGETRRRMRPITPRRKASPAPFRTWRCSRG